MCTTFLAATGPKGKHTRDLKGPASLFYFRDRQKPCAPPLEEKTTALLVAQPTAKRAITPAAKPATKPGAKAKQPLAQPAGQQVAKSAAKAKQPAAQRAGQQVAKDGKQKRKTQVAQTHSYHT